jgi:murein tripeptide amidase MpaA
MYLNVDEVESALQAAAGSANAAFTQLVSLPNLTWENRQCHAIKIANGSGPGRVGVYFLGSVHAREWGSADILINFVERVCDAYRTGSGLAIGGAFFGPDEIQAIVNKLEIIVFPQVNPDGRAFSMSADAAWRKNRRPAPGSHPSCPGVDINRNFDFLWDFTTLFSAAAGVHSSTDPCQEVYIGPSPASEPETQNAVSILDTFPSIRFFVDLHSYGEDILYSWGDDEDQTADASMNFSNSGFNGVRGVSGDAYGEFIASPDQLQAQAIANSMAGAIQAVRGRTYLVEPSFQLYPTSGASDDYSFSRHFVDATKGKVIAYTIEWGRSSNPTPFHPPYAEMQQIIDEITAGLVQFCVDAQATVKDCFVLVDRSTFGQDEVLALLTTPPAEISEAFWVVVEGFTAQELGLTSSNLGSPPVVPTVTLSPGLTAMGVQFAGPVTPEDPSLPPLPQRFRFGFNVTFTSDADFGFTGDVALVTLNATVTIGATTVTSSAVIELVKKPNPYLLDGPTTWLSIDLRVFHVRAGDTRFGLTMGPGPGDAPTFVQSVMQSLTAGGGSAGGESFETGLSADEGASSLELSPTDSDGHAVFNFALARVRMRGLTLDAQSARVFFRLFQAQSTNAVFDPDTTYRRFSDGVPGGHTIPLLGVKGGEYVTMPCFATARVNTASVSMAMQIDAANVQTIVHDAGGAEVHAFYGCWLDINQPGQGVLPASVPSTNQDGPFSGSLLSVQQAIVRSPHQCLVAEIAFDPDAIPAGVDPSTTDKIAQRNLAFESIPNPGADTSRRVSQTFEVRSTRSGATSVEARPDELMIDWGRLPPGSTAQIYWPTVKVDDVLALARANGAPWRLQRVDAHTLSCRAEAVTYVPLAVGGDVDRAGLLTIDLPAGVRRGERFDVVVRQITHAEGRVVSLGPGRRRGRDAESRAAVLRHWRRVFGAFQVAIPVHTKTLLLPREERLFSILGWIAQTIPTRSRWHPVFARYLDQIAGRVTGLGGDPGQVLPSPTGDGKHHDGSASAGDATGKVVGVIYDRFGDFEGFLLETERGGERRYHAREHKVEEIVKWAWLARAVITVHTDRFDPHHAAGIVVRRL